MLTHIVLGTLLDSESPHSQGKALVNRLDGEQGLSGGKGWGKKTPPKRQGSLPSVKQELGLVQRTVCLYPDSLQNNPGVC